MREAPAPAVQSPRQHRMQYDLATGPVRGQSCDRWQIEVTGGGRIWYLVGPENQTVWIDYAGPAHPRATD